MQNKCNRGCNAGFVPASSNWDFNIGGDWLRPRGGQQRSGRNQNTCSSGCSGQQNVRSASQTDCGDAYDAAPAACPCERQGDERTVQYCGQNTTLRSQQEARETCADHCDCTQNACTGQPSCVQARAAYAPCAASSTCPVSGGYSPCEAASQRQSACSGNAANAARIACYGGYGSMEAMVNIDVQQLGETFASESALRAGTLFPALHKPLNGYCPCEGNCGTAQQAASFAAWEMRLYLDTHPDDQQALALFRQLCREAGEENYATAFLPDSCCNTTSWNWTNDPWPWEYPCQCGG